LLVPARPVGAARLQRINPGESRLSSARGNSVVIRRCRVTVAAGGKLAAIGDCDKGMS
jgi:hypothetical protein